VRQKIKEWGRRYLLAEIMGTLTAILFSVIFSFWSKNLVFIALIATFTENIGFYGTILVQEIMRSRRIYKTRKKEYTLLSCLKDIRNIFLEFGSAELLDTATRPFIMYICLLFFQSINIGILVGKILSDIIFYIIVVISYEMRKRYVK
jgi:hypothetical protein